MATNRFVCEVCNKGFQREQNLQLHRRGHNLPWKLKQKTTKEVKRKVYLCPEPTCVHHEPSRALGDLTGIKKHYFRKHGEKKYKCEKCSKRYAVQSDWKAHSKTCGTREYRCDCGTLFSRRDSFITHRAFCDALAQESARHPSALSTIGAHLYGNNSMSLGLSQVASQISPLQDQNHPSSNLLRLGSAVATKFEHLIPPSNPSPLSHPLQPQAFFLPDSNQGYQENLMSNRSFHGLMQLPDLQSNNNNSSNPATAPSANLISPSFFSSNNNSTNCADHNSTSLSSPGFLIPDQFKNSTGHGEAIFSGDNVGSGFSSLYSISGQQESAMPHMSATALLQKAAQMGSTTSPNGASFLKGLGNSSSSDHHHQLQGLMDSLANGSSSMFGNEQESSFVRFDGTGIAIEQQHKATSFGQMDEAKLQQNFRAGIAAGSDRMTLDFLGVGGGMMRNLGGGFSQREHQHGIDISSFDSKISSGQTSHNVFSGPKPL
ncbi:protein indeterminate-domain 5, chloroplastic-like isoform X2 [Diospyros lotus]|nr:protein indeterminate-domain 5, chloroplastic-like isoform X2 [Diospyros lotus]